MHLRFSRCVSCSSWACPPHADAAHTILLCALVRACMHCSLQVFEDADASCQKSLGVAQAALQAAKEQLAVWEAAQEAARAAAEEEGVAPEEVSALASENECGCRCCLKRVRGCRC